MSWVNAIDAARAQGVPTLPSGAACVYFPIFRANLAVMSLLRTAHLSAQQSVELRELRAHWNRFGLRGLDLVRSVERLESLGLVDVDRVRGHQYVVLTEMGHRSAYSLIGLIARLALVPRALKHFLDCLKFGKRTRALHRRKSDRRDDTTTCGDKTDMARFDTKSRGT